MTRVLHPKRWTRNSGNEEPFRRQFKEFWLTSRALSSIRALPRAVNLGLMRSGLDGAIVREQEARPRLNRLRFFFPTKEGLDLE